MFDPVFSILFASAIFIVLGSITFFVAKTLMPLNAAALAAFVMPTASLLGYMFTAIVRIRLDPYFDNESFAVRVAVPFLGALFFATLSIWLVWRFSRR
jgi:hypothetical protein